MIIRSIRLLSTAHEDLMTGKAFYDHQQQGIGEYFHDCLISDMESLLIYAGIHAMEFNCYRMRSRRFPYAIYYTIQNEMATVIAILPMKLDPEWIRKKVSQRK